MAAGGARSVARAAGAVVPGAQARGRELVARLPPEVRAELATSVKRLASARTPKQLTRALETETTRLSQVVVPLLADHPLPLHSTPAAVALAGSSAALAAAFVEIDEIAIVLSSGVAAPSAASAFTALLGAFVVEVWTATSLRVHQLQADGRTVDRILLADEVTAAVLGTDVFAVRLLAGRAAAALGKRVARRFAAALVPVAGAVVEGWAATRTVRAIAAMPRDGHPPAGPPEIGR